MSVLPIGFGSEEGGYRIERSVRLNSPDSAYFSRTPGSAGNRKTWTWSAWVKRSALGTEQAIFATASNNFSLFFGTGNDLRVWTNGGNAAMYTSAVYRDVGAWYHILLQRTSVSPYFNLYVNGVQVTAFAYDNRAVYPGTSDSEVNSTVAHYISGFTGYFFNGYLTEINFIDGQALTPSSFGETDTDTGVWKPKAYSGSYGTNGFYLKFADNSGTTSTTLGKDSSGNGNNWTPNNFSVTAGAGNDSLVDTPTNYGTDTGVGGEVRGNYATLNPLASIGTVTLTNGNLDCVVATNAVAKSTISVSSGKWYWEVLINDDTNPYIGIVANGDYSAQYAPTNGIGINSVGDIYTNNTNTGIDGLPSFANTNIVGVALDCDNKKLWWSLNGQWYTANSASESTITSADVVAGNNGYVFTHSQVLPYVGSSSTSGGVTFNFGQRPFAYPLSGFKALCTQNLPEPVIKDGADYFNTILYTGTGSSNARTGVGFQPDFVWIKGRSGATDHGLYDAVRGVQKQLESNTTTAETTETTGLTAFGSDGFTVGALAQLNTSSATYVAWNWKANGAGSTNTAGTITSTVSVNTTSGFSIVTYTGTGSAATVGHGLGVAPSMVIVKKRSTTGNWATWHTGLTGGSPEDRLIYLNLTDAQTTVTDYWGTNGMTSTTFGIWNTGGDNNQSGQTFVAYCFAQIPGYSAFGSYTGNGSADGPFVYTGFRPALILTKPSSASGNWTIFDTQRSDFNVADDALFPNQSLQEFSGSAYSVDILSNGFKMRNTDTDRNSNGVTYIYMAFSEVGFKYSLAR